MSNENDTNSNWENVSADRDAAWYDVNWAFEDKDNRVVEGLLLGYYTITPNGMKSISYFQIRLNAPFKGLIKPDDSKDYVLVDLAPGQKLNVTERKDLVGLKDVVDSGTPYLVRIKVSGQRAVKGRASPMWLFNVQKKIAPKSEVPF